MIATRFHAAVADATVEGVVRAAAARGIGIAVLGGGVFCNRLLLEAVSDGLDAAGLRVLVPERVPPNDGGIALGQAAVAARGALRRTLHTFSVGRAGPRGFFSRR